MHEVESRTYTRSTKAIWIALIALAFCGCKKPAATPRPSASTQPTTAPSPTTAPATRAIAATQPGPPRTLLQLVKLHNPDYPATQPLDERLERKRAARIILHEPIYLDRMGHLWITRDDAAPVEEVVSKAWTHGENFVREQPAYVHWRYEEATRKLRAHLTPVLVCPAADGKTIEFIEEKRRLKLQGQSEKYYWPGAFSWNDRIVVGTSTGASIFARSEEGWKETPSPQLIDGKQPHAPTQVPVEAGGLLAYVPAEGRTAGSPSVARFIDGKWSLLNDKERWPGNFLHLIPLSDGSVLQLIMGPEGRVRLAMTDFDTTKIDRKRAMQLIEQLDDSDRDKRDEAFRQLSTYGSGLWPILEKEMDNQPAGVREKMELLLKNKTEPSLGEMALVDSELRLAGRSDDGGVLLYSKGGVSVTNVDGDQSLAQPAWISVRPGQAIRLMVGRAWSDLPIGKSRFYGIANGEWIASDDVLGPREVIGAFDLVPILGKKEAKYSELVGIDMNGRWVFREPGEAGQKSGETLILDPSLPPVTPQLPVWEFVAGGGKAGCDDHDWPAYKDGGTNVWLIRENGFSLLEKGKGKFIDDPAELSALPRRANVLKGNPIPTTPATARSATSPSTNVTQVASTLPSTRPSSQPATDASDPPLLTLGDGTRYYGGQTSLRRITPDGQTIEAALPSEAQGSAKPWLTIDNAGRLFLLNEPGRLVRLRATGSESEPYKVDAVFSHGIPSSEPSRMWLDPAGRIIIAHDKGQLAICFPTGIIPDEIAKMMPADKDESDE